jgi:hypothetical protein
MKLETANFSFSLEEEGRVRVSGAEGEVPTRSPLTPALSRWGRGGKG